MNEKKELYVNLGIEVKGNEHKHAEVKIKCSPGCHSSDIASAFGALADYLISHRGISLKTLLVWLLVEIKGERWDNV